jgi:prepilin-type N-terminal cleavage/methylation domain-containing protein
MTQKRSAFTLIELMISLLIASFLIMTLTMILQQTGKARQFVDILVGNGLLRTTLFEELSYDFSGMIVEKPISKKEGDKTEQKPLLPLMIKKSSEGMVEEFSFLTTNARAYKAHHKVMRVVYKLDLVDKAKKIYKITRFVTEIGKKDQEKAYGVSFLDSIIAFDIAFVQKRIEEKKEKKEEPFTVVQEWPIKKETKKTDKQQAKAEIVTHIQITMGYIKNRKGAPEIITMLIPLYNILEIPEIIAPKKEEKKQEKEKSKEEKETASEEELTEAVPSATPFTQNTFNKMSTEEIAALEDRTTKMLNSLFKLPGA